VYYSPKKTKEKKYGGIILMEAIVLTEKSALALEFLQAQSGPVTGAAIADGTGLNPQGIHGVLNSLVKKGLVAKADPITMSRVNKEGLTEDRPYVTYVVTPAGADFVAE
jgi:DNA-binding MarR family transcriptional regulator